MQLLAGVASALTTATLVLAATTAPAHASVERVPAPNSSVNPAKHPQEYENRIVARINDARARAGLNRIRVYQTCLDRHAERWAKHLAESGRLQHRNQYRVLGACNLHWTGETLARGAGGLSSIENPITRKEIADFNSTLEWSESQNEYFRSLMARREIISFDDKRIRLRFDSTADEPEIGD